LLRLDPQMKLSNEFKVGALIVTALGLAVMFSVMVGAKNPFARKLTFYVTYQFAGGVEVGSPVRVSGIKVGQVEEIEFFVPKEKANSLSTQEPGSATLENEQEMMPLRLRLSIQERAAVGVKRDSKFYINMAGIIGERYVEITPGTKASPRIQSGETISGIDPPRIDQLLSQSFDLAGKIADLVEKNKGEIGRSIELLYKLSDNLNKTVKAIDQSKVFKTELGTLVNNLIAITESVRKVTDKTQTPEGEKTLKLLHELLMRLEPLDAPAIKNFLQKEGIRARIF
jgi:phospholipid/cholesterol/gamma-HCH transport system substrate-binding protein